MATKLSVVPFDGLGNLKSWTGAEVGIDEPVSCRRGDTPDRWDQERATIWRPATPFVTKLRLSSLERGRSAARFIWKDALGHEFPMFGQWLVDAIQKGTLEAGWLTGEWGFAKRGANYSVELLRAIG
jgi:hypothetical protein